MKNINSFSCIYYKCMSDETYEWLEPVYSQDFYTANNRLAIQSAFEIGEEIYDLADIEFDTLVLYVKKDNIFSQIYSADFSSKEVYENE